MSPPKLVAKPVVKPNVPSVTSGINIVKNNFVYTPDGGYIFE
jgi:hypothetical protein